MIGNVISKWNPNATELEVCTISQNMRRSNSLT